MGGLTHQSRDGDSDGVSMLHALHPVVLLDDHDGTATRLKHAGGVGVHLLVLLGSHARGTAARVVCQGYMPRFLMSYFVREESPFCQSRAIASTTQLTSKGF